MLMPTTAVAACANSAGTRPVTRPSAITMKANSPACASRIAASTVTPSATPNRRQAANRITALTTSSTATISRIVPIAPQTTRTSIDMPTVMKNRPTSRPLTGAMSISI